jgi:hypothetical protein
MFLRNTGRYQFEPHAFTVAAGNQWNLMALADLDGDRRLDAVIGAMSLANVATDQRGWRGQPTEAREDALLYFQNSMTPRLP